MARKKDVTPPAEAPAPAADGTEELDPIAALAAVQDMGLPWADMRDKLKDVIVSVANGSVRATAAQAGMLKYIVEQAKHDMASEDITLGVVILPTQGAAATLQVSERAKKRALEAINGKA